jgi:hypothetical protein
MTDQTTTRSWVLKVEPYGPDDWCVINTAEPAYEQNYYGMIAYGFRSREEAEFYRDMWQADPRSFGIDAHDTHWAKRCRGRC